LIECAALVTVELMPWQDESPVRGVDQVSVVKSHSIETQPPQEGIDGRDPLGQQVREPSHCPANTNMNHVGMTTAGTAQ
jgi:hypothetical protein